MMSEFLFVEGGDVPRNSNSVVGEHSVNICGHIRGTSFRGSENDIIASKLTKG